MRKVNKLAVKIAVLHFIASIKVNSVHTDNLVRNTVDLHLNGALARWFIQRM